MKIIETLYEFAKQLDYQVQWLHQPVSFIEHFSENGIKFDLLVEQNAEQVSISAPKMSLTGINEAEKTAIYHAALHIQRNPKPVYFFLNEKDDTIYMRINIAINSNFDVDAINTQYILARQQILKVLMSSDLLSPAT